MGGELPGNTDGMLVGVFVGARIAGYRLEEQVGAGGMGIVFRAVDERLGRPVALKILTPELAADEVLRERFIWESRAAAGVQDPHLLPVYEAGEAGGVLFIAMKYVAGGDLRSLLRRDGPLSAVRAAAIVSAVASALDAAHAVGLVHRDVKPANMLLDVGHGRPDHVYLTDFGICRQTRTSGLTGAGQFLGTVQYAAPEQIRGTAVDERADQYALASTAFELLCGQLPFPQQEAPAVIWAKLAEPPPSVTSCGPDLPHAAAGVLAKALAREPQDRYATCQEFADALRSALDLAPYDPSAPTIRQDGRRQVGSVGKLTTVTPAGPFLGGTTTGPPSGKDPLPPSAPAVIAPEPGPGPSPAIPSPGRRRWLLVSLAAVIVAAGLAVGVHLVTSGTKAVGSPNRAGSPATTCRAANGRASLSLLPATTTESAATITGVVIAPRGTVLRSIDWNWGDGTTQKGCAVTETHVYSRGRRYTVAVIAKFSNGSQLRATETVSVPAPATTCPIPNGPALLSLFPATVSGTAVTIDGEVTAPRRTKLTGIDWNWGDGIKQAGCAYFPETHDYASVGRYTVVVTAKFSNGLQKQVTETVSVRPAPNAASPTAAPGGPSPSASSGASPSASTEPTPPVAMTCQTTNGTSSLSLFPAATFGMAVTINGVVIAPSGTKLTGIDWNWGDGITQTGCAYFPESHDYARAGQYTVVVTAMFSNGSRLEATEKVSVP